MEAGEQGQGGKGLEETREVEEFNNVEPEQRKLSKKALEDEDYRSMVSSMWGLEERWRERGPVATRRILLPTKVSLLVLLSSVSILIPQVADLALDQTGLLVGLVPGWVLLYRRHDLGLQVQERQLTYIQELEKHIP